MTLTNACSWQVTREAMGALVFSVFVWSVMQRRAADLRVDDLALAAMRREIVRRLGARVVA